MREKVRVESLSPKEAANVLGVCEETVCRLVRARKLVAFRVGRAIRIHRSDLSAYKQKHTF